MRPTLVRLLVLSVALAAGTAHAAAQALPRLENVDTAQATVSGISAGAFMANQLGWAYSSYFKGVGMFAGGPYRCAGHEHYTRCMMKADISAARLQAMQRDIDAWSGGWIDAKSNVAAQQVYLFVGGRDEVVGLPPMKAVETQYRSNGAGSASVESRPQVAHEFPTDFQGDGNNDCGAGTAPFIANCGFDGAGAVLTRLYGPLNPRNDSPAGRYIEFEQAAFTSNPGMASTGWLYVPANCDSGARCRVHVALHGCGQSHAAIGDKFIRNTGYTRWADTNSIVVLFPQARQDRVSRWTSASGGLPNPAGCFDWIGWYGEKFARKAGSQVAAIKAMVDHLSAAGGSCHADSHQGHMLAGRAYARWPFAYAIGSDHKMGYLYGMRTLRQLGPDFYVTGGC